MRCFIAIEIPDSVKDVIAGIAEDLKQTGADVRWIAPENIHITIQFLGETEESLIPAVIGALDKILSPYSPIYIKIADIGCFPDRRRPRVIWVGTEESRTLVDLHADIAEGMVRFGYREEARGFAPHVTIGRVKSGRRIKELVKRIEEMSKTDLSIFEVQGIRLMKSELTPSGAKYNCLAEIPFGRRKNVEQGQRQ